MRREFVDVAIVRPQHADLAAVCRQFGGVSQKSLGRDQHRAIGGHRRIVENTDKAIGDNLTVSNEWHRHAP